jgi:hypothetical protein
MIKASVTSEDADEQELFGYFLVVVLSMGPVAAFIDLFGPGIMLGFSMMQMSILAKVTSCNEKKGSAHALTGESIELSFRKRMDLERGASSVGDALELASLSAVAEVEDSAPGGGEETSVESDGTEVLAARVPSIRGWGVFSSSQDSLTADHKKAQVGYLE